MSDKALRERWQPELAEEVVAHLMVGRALDGLGFGEHDGRVDLRGLPVPPPQRLRRFETLGWFVEQLGDLVEFRRARLENLDLSAAQLQSLRFHDSWIENCRFDGADCRDWRMWGTSVVDSVFTRATLREAVIGAWHQGRRNAWRRASFSHSDFRVVSPLEALFEDCDFSNAKLDKVTFSQCTFVDCRFAGELRQVLFDGRELTDRPAPPPMRGVDFADASFSEVEFMGFDLEEVELPKDPDVRLVRRARCVARCGIEILGADDSVDGRILRALFERRLRGPGSDQDAEILNRRDYLKFGGQSLLRLAEDVIARAECECLA